MMQNLKYVEIENEVLRNRLATIKAAALEFSELVTRYVEPHKGETHSFNEGRDYYYPIPINERSLNPNLTQNDGWDDGLDF